MSSNRCLHVFVMYDIIRCSTNVDYEDDFQNCCEIFIVNNFCETLYYMLTL